MSESLVFKRDLQQFAYSSNKCFENVKVRYELSI